ncbi:hypothetical protein F4778DRAFT_755032 [Xylariomycetidae sp. FL2044]|nr:hypothetical protein F4778DRAFT_755032 [Xylariomycetidae sp. FL2044]
MLMKWFGEFLPRRGTDMSLLSSLSSSSPSSSYLDDHNNHDQEKGDDDGDNNKIDHPLKIPSHATWLTTTARVGSTSDNRLGGWFSYRASKAAANSLTKTFDLWLEARTSSGSGGGSSSSSSSSGGNAMAMAYHPGTVRTGLSRELGSYVSYHRASGIGLDAFVSAD